MADFLIAAYAVPKADFKRWAARGLNIVWGYEPSPHVALVEYDRALVECGLKIIRPPQDDPRGDIGLEHLFAWIPDTLIAAEGRRNTDEPERKVSLEGFRARCRELHSIDPARPLAIILQGDRITSGPPNVQPDPANGWYNKGQYPEWTEPLTYAGQDWHVAYRGYPLANVGLALDRLSGWSGGKSVLNCQETGKQSDTKQARELTPGEFRAHGFHAVIHNAAGVIYFSVQEPPNFSFDTTTPEVEAVMKEQNAWLAKLDAAPGQRLPDQGVVLSRNPNFGYMEPDRAQGWIEGVERVWNGRRTRIELNVSAIRGMTHADGTVFAPYQFRVTDLETPLPPSEPPPIVIPSARRIKRIAVTYDDGSNEVYDTSGPS